MSIAVLSMLALGVALGAGSVFLGMRILASRRMAPYRPPGQTNPQPPVKPPTSGTAPSVSLAGKVAIITGGGTGLGRAMALHFARQGAKVVVASRNPDNLNPVVDEIIKAGGEAMAVPTNVKEYDKCQNLVEQTIKQYGKIDILVNNAAGNFLINAEKLTPNGWDAVIDIVLNGTFYCSSLVGKHMIERGQGGTILNIVANYAWSGQPGVVHSASAKAGVLAMTRTLAGEWGQHQIRVNALAPGAMVTAGASANLRFDTPEAQAAIAKMIPLGRLTSAEEMAGLAAFLVSDQAAYMNGEVMVADGGHWLPRGMLDLKDLAELLPK